MGLSPGNRLGPYEIVSPLGSGGMGEVYRARDTRLDRTVAIKILSSALNANGDMKARFEREARAISQLNHPNICALHDIGQQNGTDYLVMEYVEGESLAERLRRGALPLGHALKIGLEIADALDKAHRAGIVHRDLKPANIMLTKAGAKLLDFGLAKPAASASAMAVGSAPLFSAAVTLTTPSPQLSPLTTEGTIVGTIQYMSPEQLQGQEADARSDIFALGAVLYEMATGNRAFQGKSQLSVATAILEHDPDPVSAVHKAAPPALDHVVATCLAKEPDQRWQSAADIGRELHWISLAPAAKASDVASIRAARFWWAAAAAALVLIGIIGWLAFSRPPKPSPLRLELVLPEKYNFGYGLAVSPDGSQVCFVADDEQNRSSIACRGLNSNQLRFLSGTDDARFPFWSPDGSKLGFFAGGNLKTVDLASGFTQSLAKSDDSRGADWGADNQIIFSPDPGSPLMRVPGVGGTPVAITKLDGALSDRWPHFLPDGKHFLFFRRTAAPAEQESKIFISALGETTPPRELMSASSGVIAVPGYVIFVRGRTLFAQRFNESKLRLEGDPLVLAEGLEPEGEAGPTAYAPFSSSQNGLLIYRESITAYSQLAWFDRTGKRLQDVTGEGAFDEPAVSPDGTRLVVDRSDGDASTHGIWMLDFARGTFNRFSLSTSRAAGGIWSPDGKEIVFGGSAEHTGFALYRRPSNATAPEVRIADISSAGGAPDGFSPDGRYLMYESQGPGNFTQLWLLPMSGDRKPFLYLPPAQYDTTHAAFSPDGHWVAYSSNESGRPEVYVQNFPGPHSKIQISNGGGDQASWTRDGKEIFYFAADRSIVSVPVDTRGEFIAGKPKPLFLAPMRRYTSVNDVRISYAVSPDGKRILLNARGQRTAAAPLNVVVNWPMELKK